MSDLALLGGAPVRAKPFPPHPIVGAEERNAVIDVLNEGHFSTFIATPGKNFLGGKRIQQFEEEFARYHGTKYAVGFNSATAALHAAVIGMGVQPEDEVIVTPYSFTSSATCALMNNAVPVFADIEEDMFCMDPESVEKRITQSTKAIIPVHLFGQPAAMDEILDIAKRHHLGVIEDAAQAPGAKYKGRLTGTMGDCGVYSFQESKTLMTGEGGMLVTDDERIADIARLVRNHGEAVVGELERRTYTSQILGYNYRMTEFEAALGITQLRRLDQRNRQRQELAGHLSGKLRGMPGITPPVIRKDCTHVYYVYPMLYDEGASGIPRKIFAKALQAEGIPISEGYVPPLYLSPLFQNKGAYVYQHYKGNASYDRGICPVCEDLYAKRMLITPVVRPPATNDDMDDIAKGIAKVVGARDSLMSIASSEKRTASA